MEWKTIPSASDYEMSDSGDIRRKKDRRTVEIGVLALLWCRGRQEWKDVRKLYDVTFGMKLPAPQQHDTEALVTKTRRLETELADMHARMNAAGII